jgi:spermidine/putrescine-binding protein
MAATMIVSLAGCSASKKASGTTTTSSSSSQSYAGQTLKVLTHWTNETSQGGGNGQDHLLDDFAAKFEKETGATVKFTAISDYDTDVKTMLAGNDYGDVLDIPTGVPNADLSHYFTPIGKSTDADLKNFYDPSYMGTKNSDGSWTVYGYSYGLGATGVVYNKTAFQKAGITSFPKTINDFYSACAKLKAANIVPVALNYADKWPLVNWDNLAVGAAKNADFPNELYADSSPFDATKPYGITLGILNKIVSSGWCEPSLSTTNWANSKVSLGTAKDGMMLLGSWAIPQMQAEDTVANDIGFAAMPTDNSGKLYSYVTPDKNMAISNKSKVPALARKYLLEFITSNFYDSQGFLPPEAGLKVGNQAVNDFMNSGVTFLYNQPGKVGDEATKRDDIGKDAGIDLGVNGSGLYVQAVIDASRNGTYTSELSKLNGEWAKAQKDVAAGD